MKICVDEGSLRMPIRYRIDDARRRIYTRAEGVVNYEELRTHMYAEAGERAASYAELLDCSAATTNVTPDEVQKLASARRAIAKSQPPGALAVVAADTEFSNMLRMYYRLTNQVRPLRVFSDEREAERWLDEMDDQSAA